MIAAAYIRVSTNQQDAKNQKPDVLRLVTARGLGGSASAAHWYEETESTTKRRPVYEQMMNDARAGHFTILVIWSLDRFGRNMWDTVEAVRELDRLNVQIVSVKEPWFDTGGPVRDLLLAIFAWVAQQERERLRERTRAGVARVRAEKGGKWGPEAQKIPDDAVRLAATLHDDGEGWGLIARTLAANGFLQPARKGRGRLRIVAPRPWPAPTLRRAVLAMGAR